MKAIRFIFIIATLLGGFIACKDDFGDIDFLSSDNAPTDVTAVFSVTQDNSGDVTITPTASGVVSYKIYFGDNTDEPAQVRAGASVTHTYQEGSYDVKIVALSLSGKETQVTLPLEVSFKAPENVVVTTESDVAVSKKVNVTVTADYAISYDVYFGEAGSTDPVSANIGEQASYTYAQAGTYTIKIVVKGAAIATISSEATVEAKTLVQPAAVATTPPIRNAEDVISIYSDSYTNVAGTNYNPDWGQSGQGSSFATFKIGDNEMLQYINISYQGIQFANEIDLSEMEFLHLDVWSGGVTSLETSLISKASGEKPFKSNLSADSWTSIDIPISAFTNQGLSVSDIHQLKFVDGTTPWAKGTIFIDNIYFYKKSSSILIQDFEGEEVKFTSFGNIPNANVVNNPKSSQANSSAKVAELTKSAGSETWAGTFFESKSPFDLKNFPKIKMKTLSPKANIKVLVKLENADASTTYEIDAINTQSYSWEELTFDMSAAPDASYTKFVVFFDFGNNGDGSVYYFDDIKLTK
ncbi:MAG: PKD domain protein [Capnocytophaga sp.]|nr:PKD domain protein [Capnocytophaga sp.]